MMSVRRQSRGSGHASLPDHKSEAAAAANERSMRSRTSSEDLVVLELPKIVRTKRSSHQRSAAAEVQDAIKNGKVAAGGGCAEGTGPNRQGLRAGEHSVANSKDEPAATTATVAAAASSSSNHQGSGDAKTVGRARRRSGRITSTSEDTEKGTKQQQQQQQVDSQRDGRSLRRRTRSGTVLDGVDNGPSAKPTDNQADDRPVDPQAVHGTHKPASVRMQTAASNQSAPSQAETLSSNHKVETAPESTSVCTGRDPSNCLEKGSGDTDLGVGMAAASPEVVSLRPEMMGRLEVSLETVEGAPARTSPRRTRQVQPQTTQDKDLVLNDKLEPLSDASITDAQQAASNGLRGKTGKRNRSSSGNTSSVSPRKPLPDAMQEAGGPVVPGSPKRRRTASVCRDLTQDFDMTAGKPSAAAAAAAAAALLAVVALPPDTQRHHGDSQLQDPTPAVESIPAASAGDAKELPTAATALPAPASHVTAEPVVTVDAAVASQRSRRRSGTSPRGTPHKHSQLDLTKSPIRRGLRSSGSVPESTPEAIVADDDVLGKVAAAVVTPTPSPTPGSRKSPGRKKGSSRKDATLARANARDTAEVERGEEVGESFPFSREEMDYQATEWYEEVDETEPFYFESDHMAIKGNKDYRMLLRTLTTLEAQRKQAIQDLDRLLECRDKALRNPIKFVHKLQHKESLNLPHSQRVVTCPDIDWQRYVGPAETNELLSLVSQHRSMRPTKAAGTATQAQVGQGKPVPAAPPVVPTAAVVPAGTDQDVPSTSSASNPGKGVDAVEVKQEQKMDIVRGRVAEGNKPPTFNQLWTRDEQRRLEEFLVKFPTEEVEARRWEKIAKALGNRTAQQVASRVQKYFIKLMKAGMPVPGRLPNMATYQNYRKGGKKMHAFTRPLYQPSTFLQSIQPPVYMEEDNPYSQDLGLDDDDYDDDELVSDDETVPTDVRDAPEYQELIRLKMMKRRRIRQQGHLGFRCDGCDMEPIVGLRWHCLQCPDPVSTDLCQSCVNSNFSSKHHSSSHRLEPVHAGPGQSFVDGDYTSFEPSSGDYNYLDPNYNPMQTS